MSQPAAAQRETRRPLVLGAMVLSMFMVAVEATIVATALPTIVAELGGFDHFSWVFAIYLLTQAVTIPIYGRLADLYGRKPMYFLGAALFLAASAACGFAESMLALIVFRAIQGVGAGAVQPIALTIVGDIYAPDERARPAAALSSVWGISAIAGPLIGAFIVEHLHWSLVFWINIPIGAAAVLLLALFLRENVAHQSARVDWSGALLLALGTGAFLLAIVRATDLPPAWFAGLLVAAAVLIAAFVRHERRAPDPMMHLELWRNRVILVGNLGSLATGAIMIGVASMLPVYIQGAMGATPLAAGLAIGAMSVGWPLASTVGARAMVRTSYRLVAAAGGVALLLGAAVLILLTPERGPVWAGAGAFVIGLGMGFTTVVFLVSIQGSVPWEQRGVATSSNLFMRNIGQAVGAAGFGAIANLGLHRAAPDAEALVSALMDPVQRAALAPERVEQIVGAMADALNQVYWVAALLAAITLALALRLPAGLRPERTKR